MEMAENAGKTYPHVEILESGDETQQEKEINHRLRELSAKYSHRVKKEVIYKGMLLNHTKPVEAIEGLARVEMRNNDVLVCGYPKSGTTWLEEMVYLIQTKGDVTSARAKPCYLRCPLLEGRSQNKVIPHMKSPRLMKSHLQYHLLPQSVREQNAKVIYITRHPKDVAISYYHFYVSLTELGPFTQSWQVFLSMFLDGYVVCEDWFSHVNGWWQHRANKNILWISYEEMKENSTGMIKNIAEFLGVSLSEELIHIIYENTTFDCMKSNPSTNFEALKDVFKLPFMRKGQVGDWKNYFTVSQSEQFDEILKDKIRDKELLNFVCGTESTDINDNI